MTKHTPGPWAIEESDYGDEWWFGGRGAGAIEVNGWVNGGYKTKNPLLWEQLKADSLLIAAAPDMLAALKLAAEINPYGSVENAAAREAARAAIAKATGEQQ